MNTQTEAPTPNAAERNCDLDQSQIWFDKYDPIPNPNGSSWDYGGKTYLFETYGADMEKVKQADPTHVWTMLDCDGNIYIVAGYHFVNRMGYFITQKPYTELFEEYLDTACSDDDEEDDENGY